MGNASRNELSQIRGEFGYAFAGDILFATALYSIAANTFGNLHKPEETQPPDLSSFVEALTRMANLLLDDVIFNAQDRKYTVFLFGPCPRSKALKIFQIAIDETSTPWRFAHSEIHIEEAGFKLAGSGVKSFLGHLQKNPHKAATAPYAEVFLDTISAEEDPTIGGALQQCIATTKGVRIVPIIHPTNNGENLDLHVSGIGSKSLGDVGEFRIGYDAIGFRVLEVMENQWLIENGFSKERPANPSHANETAKLMANLQHWQSTPEKSAGIHSLVKFLSPTKIDPEKYYFLGRCSKCNRPSPVMQDPSNGKKTEPFFGNGGICGTCCYCGEEVIAPVSKLRSRKGKR
ncbi:hypothetical protein [Limimaricola sp.]|uniref:hypothetical protein n=1 Tax=Limimaricola sp. TaxID=2211665 RepID=UPI004058693A